MIFVSGFQGNFQFFYIYILKQIENRHFWHCVYYVFRLQALLEKGPVISLIGELIGNILFDSIGRLKSSLHNLGKKFRL